MSITMLAAFNWLKWTTQLLDLEKCFQVFFLRSLKNVSQFWLLLLTKINFRDQKCFSVLIHFLFQLSKSMLTEVFCLRSLGLFWKIIIRQMFELISLFDEFSKGKIAWLIYYTLFEIIIKKKCFSLLLHHGRLNLIAQCSMFEYQFRNVDYWMSQQN